MRACRVDVADYGSRSFRKTVEATGQIADRPAGLVQG